MKFETFIPLKSNTEALEKARNKTNEILQSLSNEGPIKYIEPLLICSETVGLGKTHLLQAINSELKNLNVVSTYAHKLLGVFSELNDPKEALKEKLKAGRSMDSDKVKYLLGDPCSVKKQLQLNVTNYCEYLKSGDILLLDDIEYLTGGWWDESIQEAVNDCFIDIVNSYYLNGKPIIATIGEGGKSNKSLQSTLNKIPYLYKNKVLIEKLDLEDKLIALHKKRDKIDSHLFTDKILIEFANQDFDNISTIENFVNRLMIMRKLHSQ